MPIHVNIDINKHPITDIHIGRIAGDTNPDSINTYVVVNGYEPLYKEDWINGGIQFEHRYGDNILICIRKAIQALEENGHLQ
jgi:hypothetical protein